MTEKIRNLANLIRGRLGENKPLIQVVIGPRQVGKTTALKAALNGRGLYATADYPTPLPFTLVEEWWEEARKQPDKILAIDEVQKIPQLLDEIQWLIVNHKIQFVLCGSSARKLKRGS